jgi:hypothetical protein
MYDSPQFCRLSRIVNRPVPRASASPLVISFSLDTLYSSLSRGLERSSSTVVQHSKVRNTLGARRSWLRSGHALGSLRSATVAETRGSFAVIVPASHQRRHFGGTVAGKISWKAVGTFSVPLTHIVLNH